MASFQILKVLTILLSEKNPLSKGWVVGDAKISEFSEGRQALGQSARGIGDSIAPPKTANGILIRRLGIFPNDDLLTV